MLSSDTRNPLFWSTQERGFFVSFGFLFTHLLVMWVNARIPNYTKVGFLLHYADKYPKIDP
jgi:hypothetical protein